MKITVVWKTPSVTRHPSDANWHIGTVVYGPAPEDIGPHRVAVFEKTGFWKGRVDGLIWVIGPEMHLREIEATGP